MRATIYVEGGGEDSGLNAAVRQGFHRLFEKAGLKGRMPEFVPCGSGQSAHEDFALALRQRKADFVGLLADSEEPVANHDQPWSHLEHRTENPLKRPEGATDEQTFLMATCMETWIATDLKVRGKEYRGGCLVEGVLPPPSEIEHKRREDVQDRLKRATRARPNAYAKGKPSFKMLEEIEPSRIRGHLPGFRRMERILREKLTLDG